MGASETLSTEVHGNSLRGKAARKPKAMGHGYHGFSRIKQSNCKWKSEQSLPSSLNKNLVKKTRFFRSAVQKVSVIFRVFPW